MVLLQAEIRKAVGEKNVTAISGQPSTQDISKLEEEIIGIAATIPTALGGGNNGHAGVIMDPAAYSLLSGGIDFVEPVSPGVYPAGAMTAAQRPQREAEHKELMKQFETWAGVRDGLKDLILQAVKGIYLEEIKAPTIVFLNVTPRAMLTHLNDRWGGLDFVDISSLIAERDGPWSVAEVPTAYFTRVEKAIKQLERVNIQSDRTACMNIALAHFRKCGEVNPAVREWEARPVATQTWADLKVMMATEYARAKRQDTTTAAAAGYGSANAMMDDYVMVTEELVANLTEQQNKRMDATAKQLEALTASLAAMTAAFNSASTAPKTMPAPAAPAKMATETAATATRKAKCEAYRQRLQSAVTCSHFGKKHPSIAEDKCWELPANAATRPTGWKTAKTA